MIYYVKKARGYVASVLLLYTILVTYFLAHSAWNHEEALGATRSQSHAKFLDVLVQEERRHLQNFQDVVENYQGPGVREREYRMEESGTGETAKKSPDSNNDLFLETKENPTSDSELASAHEPHPKGKFQVEVEEWDESFVARRRQEKLQMAHDHHRNQAAHQRQRHQHSFQNMSSAHAQKKLGSGAHFAGSADSQGKHAGRADVSGANRQLLTGGDKKEMVYTYNTSYCLEQDLEENICKTEKVGWGHSDHVNISTVSSLFKEIGDIYIYSAFFDRRGTSSIIRFLTVGPGGVGNVKSVYWCLFGPQIPQLELYRYDLRTSSSSVKSTQLEYYAASDGHRKVHQFYIMSCEVPSELEASFIHSTTGQVTVIVGTALRAVLDTVQERVVIDVIHNRPPGKSKETDRHIRNQQFPNSEQSRSVHEGDTNGDINTSNNITANSDIHKDNDDNQNVNRILLDNSQHRDRTRNISLPRDGISLIETFHVKDTKDSGNSDGFESPTLERKSEVAGHKKSVEAPLDKIVSCVAPLHGTIGVLQIVEFVELTLLLGSRHIVFYTFRVFQGVQSVLEMYQKEGLVTVLPWNIPAPNSVWAKGRDVALNDCLYRTMFLYDWAIFHDLDEFFVPRVTPDLPSFLRFLRQKGGLNYKKHTDLVFSSAYFPPPTKAQYKNMTSVPGFVKDVNKFTTLKTVHRSFMNQHHAMRMVNVSRAIRVGAGERQKTSLTVSTRLAAVNHYSYCPRDTTQTGSSKFDDNTNNNHNIKTNSHKNNADNIFGKNNDNSNSSNRDERNNKARKDSNKSSINAHISSNDGVSKSVNVANPQTGGQNLCQHTKVDWTVWHYKNILINRTKTSIRTLNKASHSNNPH